MSGLVRPNGRNWSATPSRLSKKCVFSTPSSLRNNDNPFCTLNGTHGEVHDTTSLAHAKPNASLRRCPFQGFDLVWILLPFLLAFVSFCIGQGFFIVTIPWGIAASAINFWVFPRVETRVGSYVLTSVILLVITVLYVVACLLLLSSMVD